MLGVTILGSNSAIPAHDRHPTSQIVSLKNELILIDCGEGTQVQIAKYKIRHTKINHIYISHLHGDHYFGLIGLINSWALMNRDADLHLYGPSMLKVIIDLQFSAASTNLNYKIIFHPLGENGLITDEKTFTVESFKTIHRIECWGFLFREKKNPRKVDPQKAASYDIPFPYYEKLQMGEDFETDKGNIVKNEWVTTPNEAPKSYAFCADTMYFETLAEIVKNVQVIYHETTYLKNFHEKAAQRFHSTSVQAATTALRANAKTLIMGHFSSNYSSLDEFLTEAKEVFDESYLAIEGVTFRF